MPKRKTINDLADEVFAKLTPEDKKNLKNISKKNLATLHLSFGVWIRNEFVYGKPAIYSEMIINGKKKYCRVIPDEISSEVIDIIVNKLKKS
jgi:hypothetical protein